MCNDLLHHFHCETIDNHFEERVKYNGNFYNVIRIADNTFSHRNDIVTLNIHFGIKRNRKYAFKNSKGLTEVNMLKVLKKYVLVPTQTVEAFRNAPYLCDMNVLETDKSGVVACN